MSNPVHRLRGLSYPLLFGAVAAGTALWGLVSSRDRIDSDVYLFAWAGSRMLSVDALHTFHNSTVQAGPLELAIASLARGAGHGRAGFAIVLDLVCMAAITAAAAWFLRGSISGLLVFCGGAFVLWLPGEGYGGHPAELLIPVLWLLAADQARRGRVGWAGALVGLSGCLELWGVLGIAVLALSPDLRRASRGIALALGLPVASLLPFALGGDFNMFEYQWWTYAGPFALFFHGEPFTWYDRIAEGAVVVAVGVVVARGTRRTRESIWIVPAAIALVRIALDPVRNDYYWDVPLVLLLIGASALVAGRSELAARLSETFASSTPSSDQALAPPCR